MGTLNQDGLACNRVAPFAEDSDANISLASPTEHFANLYNHVPIKTLTGHYQPTRGLAYGCIGTHHPHTYSNPT